VPLFEAPICAANSATGGCVVPKVMLMTPKKELERSYSPKAHSKKASTKGAQAGTSATPSPAPGAPSG
jgi:hypothetical protein